MQQGKAWQLAVLGLVLSGCAVKGDPGPTIADEVHYAAGEPVPRICFSRSIDGFSDAREDSVVIRLRSNKRYLLRTSGPCDDLDDAYAVAVSSFGNCLSSGDKLRIQRFPPGGPQTALDSGSCRIRSIHEWARVESPTP